MYYRYCGKMTACHMYLATELRPRLPEENVFAVTEKCYHDEPSRQHDKTRN
jgi:hypothetical protein